MTNETKSFDFDEWVANGKSALSDLLAREAALVEDIGKVRMEIARLRTVEKFSDGRNGKAKKGRTKKRSIAVVLKEAFKENPDLSLGEVFLRMQSTFPGITYAEVKRVYQRYSIMEVEVVIPHTERILEGDRV